MIVKRVVMEEGMMMVPLVVVLLQLNATWSALSMRIRSVSKGAQRIEMMAAGDAIHHLGDDEDGDDHGKHHWRD